MVELIGMLIPKEAFILFQVFSLFILIWIISLFIPYNPKPDPKPDPKYVTCVECVYADRWYIDKTKSFDYTETCNYKKINSEKRFNPMNGQLEYKFPPNLPKCETDCKLKNRNGKCPHFEKEYDLDDYGRMKRKILEYKNKGDKEYLPKF